MRFFAAAKPLLCEDPRGQIVLTVFEGEPYSLWNVRDLARFAGLRVVRSFRFEGGVYPGYRHVRTLGNLTGEGGWKGEDRDARTFLLEGEGEEGGGGEEKGRVGRGKKRKRGDGSDDESDDCGEHNEDVVYG